MGNNVIVIGAGAAGMMAAIIAAENGASVTILEKMPRVGKKLLITGKGRCNITNIADIKELIKNMHGNGSFLYSSFHNFSNNDLIDFFENQVDYYIDENNNLYTHGGWDYGWKSNFLEAGLFPVNGGNPKDNLAKECHWSRELYYGFYSHSEDGLPKKLKEATERFNKIFVGHTSLKYPYEPFHKANFYNVDTGAGLNGKLTIMDVETDEYWQSDNINKLYPNIKNGGR